MSNRYELMLNSTIGRLSPKRQYAKHHSAEYQMSSDFGSDPSSVVAQGAPSTTILDQLPRVQGVESTKHTRPGTPVTSAELKSHSFPSSCRPETPATRDLDECGNIHISSKCVDPDAPASSQAPWSKKSLLSPKVANIGLRRSRCESTLLQSPARAGHAARMRQIFRESRDDYSQTQAESNALYPQLSNVSRKAARELKSSHPSKSNILLQNTEGSSESWSDDSGYIITGSRGQGTHSHVPPSQRIHHWLTNVSTPEYGISDYGSESFTVRSDLHTWSKEGMQGYTTSTLEMTPTYELDPFLDEGKESDTLFHWTSVDPGIKQDAVETALSSPACRRYESPSQASKRRKGRKGDIDPPCIEEGEIQLVPLSPNVCVERGQVRYHNRSLSNTSTPTRKRHPTRLFAIADMKENTDGNGSPGHRRMGTRFRPK